MVSMFRNTGMTLIELMIVIAIAALVAAVAVPAANRMSNNNLADRLYQEIQLDIRYARSHASTTARQIKLEPVSNWQKGWQVVDVLDDVVIRSRSHNLDTGVITSAAITSATPLIFNADGQANNSVTLTIKVPGCYGNRVRSITVNRIGQIQISGVSLCP